MPDGWKLVAPAASTKADGWTLVQPAPAAPESTSVGFGIPAVVTDAIAGAAKGVGSTVVGLGDLFHHIPGIRQAADAITPGGNSDVAFTAAQDALTPKNTAEKVGKYAEQVLEYLIPAGTGEKVAQTVASKLPSYARLLPEIGRQAAISAGVAAAHGEDASTAGALGAAAPVVGGAIGKGLQAAGDLAEPLVRAAIKPTVASLKKVAGASQTGLDAQAERLVKFVIDNKITTAAKASAIFQQSENELTQLLASKNPATDAPQRATRYLQALERSAAKQGLPAQDVATIRNAMAEVLDSGLGQDSVKMVPTPHPTLVGPNGQPITVLSPVTTRTLRTDVTAQEALDRARANSQWDTRKAWGEQKGAQMEASKAVERAERDAVKTAVPEAKPILARQSQAITAKDTLDRMEVRAGNRDAASLPAHVIAAGELASGRPPVVAFAANWLRNNQLKAGMWAAQLRQGVSSNNAKMTAKALQALGVAVPEELLAGQR